MKVRFLLFSIAVIFSGFITAQELPLKVFKEFTGKTWKAEGSWGDGSKFKQEATFEFALDSTLVIVRSKGFTDKARTNFGMRNYGIRKYDVESETIRFWEFDVFGGLTEGIVAVEGENLYYVYPYGSGIVTDAWEKEADGSYKFVVGERIDGVWKQTYLTTKFTEE